MTGGPGCRAGMRGPSLASVGPHLALRFVGELGREVRI